MSLHKFNRWTITLVPLGGDLSPDVIRGLETQMGARADQTAVADQYISRRVDQVIRKANGDVAVAEKLLHRLCEFDGELMRRLVSPYLPAIVSRTISPSKDTVAASKRAKAKALGRKPKSARSRRKGTGPQISTKALDAVVGQMAQKIGETKSPMGMTALVQPTEKVKCSERHVEAVQQLVSSYRKV